MDALYIHIPFCKQRCIYCDFYSTLYDSQTAARYIDVLIEQSAKAGANGPFSTIYIGGGTPSALDKDLLAKLLKNLKPYSTPSTEWTIEANPESLDDDKIALCREAGVNRLSIGVQSLNDRKLRLLGRIHTAKQGRDAVQKALRRGFHNISVDLIFGVWDDTPESWQKELDEVTKLPITHISCYALTYEKNTPLWQALANKSIRPLDDSISARMYESAIETLSVRGFKQYEVSNFAKEGYACRHNMRYWDNGSYTGLGPSAVSYHGGERLKNVEDLKMYIECAEEGQSYIASREKLSPVRRAKETAAVKIRTRDGIDFAWFRDNTGFDFMDLEKKPVASLIEQDLIKYKKDGDRPTGVCLRRKGFLFCDTVSSSFL